MRTRWTGVRVCANDGRMADSGCWTMTGSGSANRKSDRDVRGESGGDHCDTRREMFEVMEYIIEKVNKGWRFKAMYEQLVADGRIKTASQKQFYYYAHVLINKPPKALLNVKAYNRHIEGPSDDWTDAEGSVTSIPDRAPVHTSSGRGAPVSGEGCFGTDAQAGRKPAAGAPVSGGAGQAGGGSPTRSEAPGRSDSWKRGFAERMEETKLRGGSTGASFDLFDKKKSERGT